MGGLPGITLALMALPAKNQNTPSGVILMELHDRPVIEYRSFNMMEIKRSYPITQSFGSDSDEMTSLDQPLATQEYILNVLNVLNVMLKNFSETKKAFEESLPALESIEMSSKIPSVKDNNVSFKPGILFPEDRCDAMLIRHASTLYCSLDLAYKKQHEFDMDDNVFYLSNLDSIANEFRSLLEGLSDKVSTYELHSSAFSLARHAELGFVS